VILKCVYVTQKQKPARPSALPSRPPPPRPSPVNSLGAALPGQGQGQGQTGRSGLTPSPVGGRAAATPSPTPLGTLPY